MYQRLHWMKFKEQYQKPFKFYNNQPGSLQCLLLFWKQSLLEKCKNVKQSLVKIKLCIHFYKDWRESPAPKHHQSSLCITSTAHWCSVLAGRGSVLHWLVLRAEILLPAALPFPLLQPPELQPAHPATCVQDGSFPVDALWNTVRDTFLSLPWFCTKSANNKIP